MCSQLLTFILNDKVEVGLVDGYNFKEGKVAHLLYTDDLLLVTKADQRNAKVMVCALE